MSIRNTKLTILMAVVALFLCACWIAATPTLTPTHNDTPTQTIAPIQTATQLSALRYDGVYQSVQQDSTKYLRFYEDGTVLSVGSTGNPEEVAAWLNKACLNCSEGQYVIRDSILEFTATSNVGAVDFTGTINGEELTLDIYSHINGFNATYVYHFVEIPGMQP